MTFKYEGKVYQLVPDDKSNPDVCADCAFKDNNSACAAAARSGAPDCIDGPVLSHYEEVPAPQPA